MSESDAGVHRIAALLAALMVVCGAEAALAGGEPAEDEIIRVEFDFGASSLELLGGAIAVPPEGEVTLATAIVDFTGDGSGRVAPGPAVLRSFELELSVDAVVATNQDVEGTVAASQVEPVDGTLDMDSESIAFQGDLVADVFVDLTCSGPFCSEFADFPIAIDDEVVFTQLGSLTVTNVADGPATASGSFDIEVGGMQGTMMLAGSEVARIVPEPSSIFWAAVVPIALLRRRARVRAAA